MPSMEKSAFRNVSVKISMKLVKAVCPYCGVGCRITARVDDQRVLEVFGDKTDLPNHGLLCQKGAFLHKIFHDKERLTHPLLRTKRDGPLEKVSWGSALSFIAEKFHQIRRHHGNEAIAFYGSGQLDTEASYAFTKLFKGALGTNHMDTNSRLCMASAATAYARSLGSDGPPPCYDDIDLADVFFVIGANMAVNHPVLFQRMRARRAASASSRILVLDPRETKTAQAADLHIPLAPGSDVAFLLLLTRKLLDLGRLDRDFIEKHTSGFSDFQAQVKNITPDQEKNLLAICGIPEILLARTVYHFESPARLLSFYCQGLNQSTHGVDNNLAVINLHLLLGEIGIPGAGPFSLTGQPNAMGGREVGYLSHQLPGYRFVENADHRAQMEKLWSLPAGRIHPKAGLSAVALFEAMREKRIKAAWIACTNPVVSMPEGERIKEALTSCELVIAQDCHHPTETTVFADVLLPAAQWGEKTGTMTNSERLVSRSEMMTPAPGEALPDWKIACLFGEAMGFYGFSFQSAEEVWNEIRLVTQGRPCDVSGITNEKLSKGPIQWPCPEDSHPGTPRLYSDQTFPSSPGGDGKAHFIPTPYRPPGEWCDPDYPLLLTTGRVYSQWHTRSRTGKIHELNRLDPEPFIEIHPEDAEKYGVTDKTLIRLIGKRGTCMAKARVTPGIRVGLVFMPFHWGDLYDPDSNVNDLTSPFVDPLSKQPELKLSSVRIEIP